MIPRLIHRIWIEGSPPASPEMVRHGVRWEELNPGWTVRTWGGPDGFTMTNACLYRRAPWTDGLRYRSDLLRLEILLRFGGLYVDMDVEPLRPIEGLMEGSEAVAAWSPNLWKGKRVLSNAFLAAVPGHPWIQRCVDKMRMSIQTYTGQFTAMVTGPHHVNRCLQKGDHVTILEPPVVYPTRAEELPTAYTFHSWANRAKLKRREVAAR